MNPGQYPWVQSLMNFAIFLHIAPYAGPAERHGSVLLACRRATERYHMVSWQKYKVPLAVWSTVLNLNAKSDNWVRQEKRLSGKVLFISFYYFIFLSLYLFIYLFACFFSRLPLPFFFLSPWRRQIALWTGWIQRGGGFMARNPSEGLQAPPSGPR